MELLGVREVMVKVKVDGLISEGNIERHTGAQVRIASKIVDGNYIELVVVELRARASSMEPKKGFTLELCKTETVFILTC